MQDKEKIIINDYIQGDPLREENLNKTLEYANRFRLLLPKKTIWVYSGFTWEQIMYPVVTDDLNSQRDEILNKRKDIVKSVDILIDGRYIDSQRNISAKWKGSDNQRVISVQESLQEGELVLYCE